ncbi:ElyC/SanA/YdcF family protein [Bauldia litoralis]|uniref:Uncharacterized SAM-binding protein YcdF, DUF218 family n=1 Tax=Bauldia litoralis TaxID=665467 RepID=A0A1G6CV61_9HYPH|nr:ElyC/SanA/YdcF family protein [Bauldia litoralis]SDB36766.1 Uncharacterized SAM-binding protein YcdF, DUF218 family [Bauldia litoralis]
MLLLPALFWAIALGLALSCAPGFTGHVGEAIAIVGFLIAFALSLRPVANVFLLPLERRYPPLDIEALEKKSAAVRLPCAAFVAVLGAGDRHRRPDLPAIAQLQLTGLARLAEGVRIVRSLPDASLVACSFSVGSQVPRSAIADAARELGVERVMLTYSTERPSTRTELKALKAIVSTEPFILVTSAAHMPRSMELCESIGLQPLPAPTDFLARSRLKIRPRAFLPSTQSIVQSERAIYEYAARLRGHLFDER